MGYRRQYDLTKVSLLLLPPRFRRYERGKDGTKPDVCFLPLPRRGGNVDE